MTNWMQYLLEVNIYLAVAYGCYWLLFGRQTFYTANRVYLLLSAAICFAIPLVQIGFAEPVPTMFTEQQIVEPIAIIEQTSITIPIEQPILTPFKATTAIYTLGALLIFVLFILKLYSLLKLVSRNIRSKKNGYTLVFTPQASSPFSFFGYLFIKSENQLNHVILQHELVHIRQKHSFDMVFTELLKIVCWFNPIVYLLQNSLKALHEFEADRLTNANGQPDGYVGFLIGQACESSGLAFANHFSDKQLLKSRIMKLYQKRSGKLARLNYLIALPLCAGMLFASSVAFSKDYGLIKIPINTPSDQEVKPIKTSTPKKNNLLMVQYLDHSKKPAITEKVEVFEKDGKAHVYTPLNITDADLVRLKKEYKVWIQIMHFKTDPRIIATPASASSETLPSVEKPTSPQTTANPYLKVSDFKHFKKLGQHIKDNFNYPPAAIANKIAGYTSVSFKINNDQKLDNARVIETLSPEVDAALLKSFNSYKMHFTAKPGNYTIGFILALEESVVRDSLGRIKGFKNIHSDKNHHAEKGSITIMLAEKSFQYTLNKRAVKTSSKNN